MSSSTERKLCGGTASTCRSSVCSHANVILFVEPYGHVPTNKKRDARRRHLTPFVTPPEYFRMWNVQSDPLVFYAITNRRDRRVKTIAGKSHSRAGLIPPRSQFIQLIRVYFSTNAPEYNQIYDSWPLFHTHTPQLYVVSGHISHSPNMSLLGPLQ